MNSYEAAYVIRPDLPKEQLDVLTSKLKESIEKRGGTITKVLDWGIRKLAYPIKNFFDAGYLIFQFKLEPNHVEEIKREYTVNEQILRYLVITADKEVGRKPKEEKTAQTPDVTKKEEGDDINVRTDANAGTE